LDKTLTDTSGKFSLKYPQGYTGAAILQVKDSQSVILLLNNENFDVEWKNLNSYQDIKFAGSQENTAFAQGLEVYKRAEERKSGLSYLNALYPDDPGKRQMFQTEFDIQARSMDKFLAALSTASYARYYLQLRKLLDDMSLTANNYMSRLAENEATFNAIDFSDQRMQRSGLYTELIEAFVVLMESHGNKKYEHLHKSTDAILTSLRADPGLKQDTAEFLFKLFEKRSLFPAAERVALEMLSDADCQLDGKREALFEQYRKMAIGNVAPDIVFSNATKRIEKLSEVNAKYKLVVFGASWCPKCVEEIPRLKSYYADWKKANMEIVFISLDNTRLEFESFVKDFPWISSTDFESWEGKAARDYFVSGTPTMYLLGTGNKIILKPVSPEQVSSWMTLNK
jgi:thiol-disulfide isomerase/thioredoxin